MLPTIFQKYENHSNKNLTYNKSWLILGNKKQLNLEQTNKR